MRTSNVSQDVRTIKQLLEDLPPRPDLEGMVRGFVAPLRFSDKRFTNYEPAHPSQEAAERTLRHLAIELDQGPSIFVSLRERLRRFGPAPRATSRRSLYLDGGFGVGKTHLLASVWTESPTPKSYLSFDELMYFIGLFGIEKAARAFEGHKLIAVDEWELDDPGNLKLALAWLRPVLDSGSRLVVTSNTLPLELGAGRFSQKDFKGELDDLASRFDVIRIQGEDYRHRRFSADPGRDYFIPGELQDLAAARAEDGVIISTDFETALQDLASVHPIRYAEVAEAAGALAVHDLQQIDRLPDALRWVHFIDSIYDAAVPLVASATISLGEIFPQSFIDGPYGKKVSRCLSRMEEMLAESAP